MNFGKTPESRHFVDHSNYFGRLPKPRNAEEWAALNALLRGFDRVDAMERVPSLGEIMSGTAQTNYAPAPSDAELDRFWKSVRQRQLSPGTLGDLLTRGSQ
jgi:hypothetical protein